MFIPKVSIGTITIRYGGLDWQMRQLASQTFKDFEWIIVDALYEERKKEIYEQAKELGIHVIHLPEPDIGYKTDRNIASNYNHMLSHVSTPYFISMEDWHVVPENFVEVHMAYLQQGLAATFKCVFADLTTELPYDEFACNVAQMDLGLTVDEIIEYKKQESLPLTKEQALIFLRDRKEDHRVIQLAKMHPGIDIESHVWKIGPEWWWPNATSALTEIIIDKCGGFDESNNGGTGGEDTDLAIRMGRAGIKIVFDPRIVVFHINHIGKGAETIKAIERKDGICKYHPKEQFRNDSGGLRNAESTDDIEIIHDDGVVFMRCKKCGWNGVAHSYDIHNRNARRQTLYPPTMAAGLPRNNLLKKRIKLFDSGYNHRTKCACCKESK